MALHSSESKKAYYSRYPAIATKHRVRRLERHLKAHPNDKQATVAVENSPECRGARKPIGKGIKVWSTEQGDAAQAHRVYRNAGGRAAASQMEFLRVKKSMNKALRSATSGVLMTA